MHGKSSLKIEACELIGWCFATSRSQSTQEIFTFTRNQAATISISEEELITGLIIKDTESLEDTEEFEETIIK